MFAIATQFTQIPPSLIMTHNGWLAWNMFFSNVKDNYSSTVRFHENYSGRSVSYDAKTKTFDFRNY